MTAGFTALALVIFSIMLSTMAHAEAKPVRTDTIKIVLLATSSQMAGLELGESWPSACAALGASMKPGSGPWGLGVFPAHSCATITVNTLDEDDKDGAKGVAKELAEWTLLVRVTKRGATLELIWKTADAAARTLATASITSEWPADILADDGFARLVSARLLDQMPFIGRLDDFHGEEIRTPTLQASTLPPPPKALSLYRLHYDAARDLWRPRTVGSATLKGATASQNVWRLGARAKEEDIVYVLNSSGRGTLGKTLEKRQRTAEKGLGGAIRSKKNEISFSNAGALLKRGVSSGYFGFRYGHSVFQGPVIEDLSFFGLLLELRGAPFDGLRLYYDQWPEVKANVVSGADAFSGQRGVFGWSFGFDPGFLVSRLDATPKIGIWSTRTRFLVLDEDSAGGTDQTQYVDFEVANAVGLGLEIGAEVDAGWALARGWVARDFGFNPFEKGDDRTSVSNTRFGVDTFLTGPRFSMLGRPSALSFLLFGLYENVLLTRKENATATTVSIDKIEYDVGYLGGGVAVSY